MKVPLVDLQIQYASLRDEVLSAITRVCDAQQFIMGPDVETFEEEIAAFIGVRFAIGVSSGTDALLLALMTLGIGPGDEVITPTFSFFATAGSVARVGARPVFVDIDDQTFNVDVERVRAAITPRTKAIIPVHLFGLCADVDALVEAAGTDIHIIEDAAQAIGAAYRGRPAGTLGSVGCFSFFPTKNLGAFGDGGLVTTNDPAVADRLRLLRNHGARPKYVHHAVGGNFRLDALQAAILRVKLPHLTGWTAKRSQNAARYRQLFADAGLTRRVSLPIEPADRSHIYNQFVIRLANRERVRERLTKAGVGTEIYYPVPFHRQECFKEFVEHVDAFPNADTAAEEALALPIYPELSEDQQRYVVSSVAEALS